MDNLCPVQEGASTVTGIASRWMNCGEFGGPERQDDETKKLNV